jgi:hypothetical protein
MDRLEAALTGADSQRGRDCCAGVPDPARALETAWGRAMSHPWRGRTA